MSSQTRCAPSSVFCWSALRGSISNCAARLCSSHQQYVPLPPTIDMLDMLDNDRKPAEIGVAGLPPVRIPITAFVHKLLVTRRTWLSSHLQTLPFSRRVCIPLVFF